MTALSPRAAKAAANKIDNRVDASFRRVGCNVQIPIMSLSVIMNAGRAAIAANPAITDEALDVIVKAAVENVAAPSC